MVVFSNNARQFGTKYGGRRRSRGRNGLADTNGSFRPHAATSSARQTARTTRARCMRRSLLSVEIVPIMARWSGGSVPSQPAFAARRCAAPRPQAPCPAFPERREQAPIRPHPRRAKWHPSSTHPPRGRVASIRPSGDAACSPLKRGPNRDLLARCAEICLLSFPEGVLMLRRVGEIVGGDHARHTRRHRRERRCKSSPRQDRRPPVLRLQAGWGRCSASQARASDGGWRQPHRCSR